MSYVDGFLVPVPKKNLKAYQAISVKAGKIWRKYGALQYCECAADDLDVKWGKNFTLAAKPKRGETVVFSFIVYKSRAQRDKVNAKVMQDKAMLAMMQSTAMPFDVHRMYYGGFKTIVDV